MGRSVPNVRHLEALSLALEVDQSELAPDPGREVTAEEFLVLKEDRDEAHLKVRQRVPMEVALAVLEVLQGQNR
jgi:hypothetical protein